MLKAARSRSIFRGITTVQACCQSDGIDSAKFWIEGAMQLRFSQIHVTILNFVLIAALAIVSAMCVRDIIARSVSNDADTPVSTSAHRMSIGARTRAYYDQIVKRDIFNERPQESGPVVVPEADLNIKLIGTSILSRSKPYAIIEDPAGNESLYQLGEDIPDAPPSELGAGAIRGPGLRGLSAAMRNRLRGLRHNLPNHDNDDSDDDNSSSKIELKKVGPGKFEVSRAEVQQTMENPAQFFSQMRAMPHFVNGKTDGFSISQVAPGSVFDQLGLQNGDLLTSIDGQPVTNPMQAMGLIQAVETASAIDLTVNRGGAPTSVHLDLR